MNHTIVEDHANAIAAKMSELRDLLARAAADKVDIYVYIFGDIAFSVAGGNTIKRFQPTVRAIANLQIDVKAT